MTAPATDFYALELLLAEEDRELLHTVRDFLAKEVEPIITEYWSRAAFPFEIMPGLRALGTAGLPYEGFGCGEQRSNVLDGMLAMELSRVDPSIATFHGVHSGLSMGSIYLCGSDEQKDRWLPAMARWDLIGAFGLTEPEVGSGAFRGLATTARRDGDDWVLNGRKKWIGNATFADLTVIWARDVADDQVKGFVVEKDAPGFTAAVLLMTRAGVAWMAVGCALGAYENALAYAKERHQFGWPIAGFQLVQDLLVRMLGNITSSATLCARLSQLQDAGMARMRESVVGRAVTGHSAFV